MNKKLLLFLIIGLGVLILLIANLFQKNNSINKSLLNPTPTVVIPPNYSNQVKIPSYVTIDQVNNKAIISNVKMNNFFNSANILNKEGDMQVSDATNSGYNITYLSQFNEFLISINKSPFDQFRIQAENNFLTKLGINQQEACKLTVVITTPRFVNPNQAGQNYSLSFCQ